MPPNPEGADPRTSVCSSVRYLLKFLRHQPSHRVPDAFIFHSFLRLWVVQEFTRVLIGFPELTTVLARIERPFCGFSSRGHRANHLLRTLSISIRAATTKKRIIIFVVLVVVLGRRRRRSRRHHHHPPRHHHHYPRRQSVFSSKLEALCVFMCSKRVKISEQNELNFSFIFSLDSID